MNIENKLPATVTYKDAEYFLTPIEYKNLHKGLLVNISNKLYLIEEFDNGNGYDKQICLKDGWEHVWRYYEFIQGVYRKPTADELIAI